MAAASPIPAPAPAPAPDQFVQLVSSTSPSSTRHNPSNHLTDSLRAAEHARAGPAAVHDRAFARRVRSGSAVNNPADTSNLRRPTRTVTANARPPTPNSQHISSYARPVPGACQAVSARVRARFASQPDPPPRRLPAARASRDTLSSPVRQATDGCPTRGLSERAGGGERRCS